MFPVQRPRRLRQSAGIRALVRETSLDPGDFILPLFFSETLDEPHPVGTMPGVFQLPVRAAAEQARLAMSLGLGGVILFGLPKTKDASGSSACDPNGPVPRAVAAMKDAAPELVVITDTCVDEYTDHGHCGILKKNRKGEMVVDNDATLDVLARSALVQAQAGADVVAPSDMMDGRIGKIRSTLDAEGLTDTAILSYAVKYASGFYGPFREAADVAIVGGGDRKTYQQDFRNGREALAEVAGDVAEGADMVMVKPALTYLDVVAAVRATVDVPVAAYHVSGEYAMVKAAAERGWIDGPAVALEQLTAVRRAGADVVLTYFAGEIAEVLGA